MCGIFASRDKRRVHQALLHMVHRGPDASDIRSVGGYHVGFNRLAIVDTQAPEAHQPYMTRKGNVVVFNGEIYNYRALWREAPSEIALIAEMLDERLDPREYFDGDYAILYYNPSLQTIDLWRDRFGVCPLYYSRNGDVSSEQRRLDAGSYEVPAHGHVRLAPGARVVQRDVMPLYGATGSDQRLSTLIDALQSAVASRASHSDSGFSLALSGGLDSSLIAYSLSSMGLRPLAAICASFSEESEDLKAARVVADALHFDLYPVPAYPDSRGEIERIREHFDGPISPMRWRGGLRTYAVAKHAPTRVILGGDGPDELIGGYPSHHKFARAYRTTAKRLSTVRSMQHFNLDRTNKMGMAHSKEYRAPFLESTLSQLLLSVPFQARKQIFRDMLHYMGAPDEIVFRESKYSPDELAIESVPQ
jgi:asparagine synthase (glutamine-hydrolysing)